MRQLRYMLPALGLAFLATIGCRSTAPTVNPFLGRTTVPAQPTGAIGAGANVAPYYQGGVPTGAPMQMPAGGAPPAGPYGAPAGAVPYGSGATVSPPATYGVLPSQPGQQQWLPRSDAGTIAADGANSNLNFTGAAPQLLVSGDVIDLDAQFPVSQPSGGINSPVQAASYATAATASTANRQATESAVRIPTDAEPLIAQRQVSAPVTLNQTPAATMPATPPVDTRQPYTQTLLPAAQVSAPLTASAVGHGATLPAQGVPAHLVHGALTPIPAAQVQLQPIPASAALPATVTVTHNQVLAYVPSTPGQTAPTLATAAVRPPVEITDLPPVQRTALSVGP